MSVQATEIGSSRSNATKVVLVTTVMLTFISFWRAAAIVLNDLASTAYYIGGIAEQSIGKAAPWFILMVMLFSYAVRAVYVESCTMFVRGGVYRVVHEALGGVMAKLSVSALIFDYVLTGPISAVAAGQYLHGLLQNASVHFLHRDFPLSGGVVAVAFAVGVTLYFWRLNIRGIEESSDKALKIMQVTTVMVAIIIVWALASMSLQHKFHLPPMKVQLTPGSLGWLEGVPWMRTMGAALFVVAFGHSILAMSGEETLAQVYREIEAPKHKNLMRAGLVIFVYSMLFTSFVSFAAVMLIPDDLRQTIYKDNLISGLVMFFSGPGTLKLAMQAFVVIVGAMILSGAANTSIIGANGVLNRVAEDGILAEALRKPHRRFGTTNRIIHLIVGLQVITILLSRGDVILLGEAYAFGVVWSFVFKSFSMLVLRFKRGPQREWKVPLNPVIFGVEIPVGLALIMLVLLSAALVNLLTKPVATVSGLSFTGFFFALFCVSEWLNRKAKLAHGDHREKFVLQAHSESTELGIHLRPNSCRVLVPTRDPNNLSHLRIALEEANRRASELIVLTVKVEKGDLAFNNLFTTEEEHLFTRVVELAEKYGEAITPMVVASNSGWHAIVNMAEEVGAEEILLGKSGRISPETQLEQVKSAWRERSAKTLAQIHLRIVAPGEPEIAWTLNGDAETEPGGLLSSNI